MKNKIVLSTLAVVMLGACVATEKPESSVSLENCAIQTTIPGAKATGAFLTINKAGAEALTLVSATAPSVTGHVEIHAMKMEKGRMMMKKMDGFELQQGANIFKKGGYHIMLMGLEKSLAVGEQHALTLQFSDGSSQTCQAQVKSVEALTPKSMGKMKSH